MNKTIQKKKEEGFTIIEVLIVLAIAGLIMLIVFLAVPALQRNSRTSKLKGDASKSAALLQEGINNNNGAIPAAAPTPIAVANAQYAQITNLDYSATGAFVALPGPLVQDTLYVRQFSTCGAGGSGREAVAAGGTTRNITITYLVEAPGTAAVAGAGGNPVNFVAQCIAL